MYYFAPRPAFTPDNTTECSCETMASCTLYNIATVIRLSMYVLASYFPLVFTQRAPTLLAKTFNWTFYVSKHIVKGRVRACVYSLFNAKVQSPQK